jgi:septal ring factor EnvC (AmiA/AmiB activator)
MKDHIIAGIHSQLRAVAIRFVGAQQLGERLLGVVAPMVRELKQNEVMIAELDKEIKRQDKKIIEFEQRIEQRNYYIHIIKADNAAGRELLKAASKKISELESDIEQMDNIIIELGEMDEY